MMTRICFFVYIFLLWFQTLYSQTIKYKFIAEKPLDFMFQSQIDEVEYFYQRMYTTKNVFVEKGVFYPNDSLTFKIKGKKWYIRSQNKWKLFYGPNKKPETIIMLLDGKKSFISEFDISSIGRDCNVNKWKCIVYQVAPISASYADLYWFHPEFGFIKVLYDDNNSTTLIRQDIKEGKEMTILKEQIK